MKSHTAKNQYRKFKTYTLFPEKELRGHSPNFQIHVSVSDFYIPTIDLPILLQDFVDRSWEYMNRSQTHEYRNWDWGRAIPRKGYINGIFVAVQKTKPWPNCLKVLTCWATMAAWPPSSGPTRGLRSSPASSTCSTPETMVWYCF